MKKVNCCKVFIVIILITMFAGYSCNSLSTNEEKIKLDEPVKTFLKDSLKSNYSFYTLKTYLPVEMDDLRRNGIYVGSRVPDGLLPSKSIKDLYDRYLNEIKLTSRAINDNINGDIYHKGLEVTLFEGTDGMDKFDGINLRVIIGVPPDGCAYGFRKKNVKSIILFSDDDFEKVTDKDFVKVVF